MEIDDRVVKLIEYMGYNKKHIQSLYFKQEIEGEANDVFIETVQIIITAYRGHAKDVKIDDKIELPDEPYKYDIGEEDV